MTDFDFVAEFVTEFRANSGDDSEARNAGGFVDEDDLVFHICYYNIFICCCDRFELVKDGFIDFWL